MTSIVCKLLGKKDDSEKRIGSSQSHYICYDGEFGFWCGRLFFLFLKEILGLEIDFHERVTKNNLQRREGWLECYLFGFCKSHLTRCHMIGYE